MNINEEFTINDLMDYDFVITRGGKILIVLYNDYSRNNMATFSPDRGCSNYLHEYETYSMRHETDRSKDILAVYRFIHPNWTILNSFFRGELCVDTLDTLWNDVSCVYKLTKTI